ncbi:MAG: hypothetical protein WCX82_01030 [archaeon]|jgi:hypothetical protein
MKNKSIILFAIFLLIINGIYALPGAYNSDLGGNLMGYIPDQGVSNNSIYDLREIAPQDDWYNRNIAVKGFGPPRIVVCNNVTQYCKEVEGDVQTPIDIKIPQIRTLPVDYFSQSCIDQGFIRVTGFPFTYKCSEDKTGFYVCYKRSSGIYIEPNLHPFSSLGSSTRNKLKDTICALDQVPNTTDQENVELPQETDSSGQSSATQSIDDADMYPSLIEKIKYLGFNSEGEGAFGYMPTPRTKLPVPYFIINYETEEKYQTNDTNLTVYLDSQNFNLNKEIYAIVATQERYGDVVTEINNFIKTQNSEYRNYQQYLAVSSQNRYVVDCYCKQKNDQNAKYKFTTGRSLTPVVGEVDSVENKVLFNNICREVCVTGKTAADNIEDFTPTISEIYEYDADNYDLEIDLPYKIINNYKLTKTQIIDKVKFLPNGNTFQFTIERSNPNKKFIIVFLQKDNKRLNTSYSNFYVLNNDEIMKYSQCEANRNVLSFFCNKYMNSDCKVIKSCYNESDLNFNAIDVSGLVYSSVNSNAIEEIPSEPIVSENPPEITSSDLITQPTYFSTKNRTGDSCSNAGLTTENGQNWGCVCSISSSGVKKVIAAKCTSNYGLVLYGITQKREVTSATAQECYSDTNILHCR